MPRFSLRLATALLTAGRSLCAEPADGGPGPPLLAPPSSDAPPEHGPAQSAAPAPPTTPPAGPPTPARTSAPDGSPPPAAPRPAAPSSPLVALPAPEPPIYVRRSIELVPQLGLSLPVCIAGDASDDRCAGVRTGLHAAASVLWRVTPHLAWGGKLQIAGFRNQPAPHLAHEDARAAAAFIGLLGRWYLLEEGKLDPYLEVGLGGGALGTSYVLADERYSETGAGPALLGGGGVDFILTRRLRIGPAASYTHVFVDKIRRCSSDGDACEDIGNDALGVLSGFLDVGARLTVMLGDEL